MFGIVNKTINKGMKKGIKKSKIGAGKKVVLKNTKVDISSKNSEPKKEEYVKKQFTEKEKKELLETVRKLTNRSLTTSSMNKYVINPRFLKLIREEFLDSINKILNMMQGNINYPTPSPPLSVIKGLIELEGTARSKRNTSEANGYKKDIKNLMRQLCGYIADTCGNNVNVLRSAGVHENKGPDGRKRKAPRAKIIKIKDTKRSGEAKVSVEAAEGMKGIQGRWRYANDENETWFGHPFSTGISLLYEGIPKGSAVIFQVRFQSSLGYGDWSRDAEYVVR